jgi:hypothetical protein
MPTRTFQSRLAKFFADYSWFILKNILGWILILLAGPVGVLLPGPGGIPIFLIGFALVTFPGKRNLTARVLHGVPIDLSTRVLSWITAILAVTIPIVLFWYLAARQSPLLTRLLENPGRLGLSYLASLALVALLTQLILRLANLLIRIIPAARRKVRPWLRRKGINLLPPRRRQRTPGLIDTDNDGIPDTDPNEILTIHPRHHDRLASLWKKSKPWISRFVGLAITTLVLIWFARRLGSQWDVIKPKITATDPWRVVLSSFMFAIFLFVFRALTWRRILIGFGHRLPVAASTRIWATSELARYVPGSILQFVGRALLCQPYGVSAASCSASQILELMIFLLANLFTGLICLPFFGSHLDPESRPYLLAAAALAPFLLLLLHPKIFYNVINTILTKVGRPPITVRLQKRLLFQLMLWTMLGLIVQGLAIWVLVSQPETSGLTFSQFPLILGAYSLAWSAGFLVFTNSAGLGVREAALVTILRFSLPLTVLSHFDNDPKQLKAYLIFLGVLLRFITVIGELILTALVYLFDYKGALGTPNAPGRQSPSRHNEPTPSPPTPLPSGEAG